MARTNNVKKARKSPGECAVCGKIIEAGKPYKWIHPRYRAKIVACPDCVIPVRMTSSSKMVAVWEAQETVNSSELSCLADNMRSLAETAREVGQEYQDGADNQREYFPDSAVADENEQKNEDLSGWADDIDSAADEVDTAFGELEELQNEQSELQSEKDTLEADNLTEEQAARVDEIQTRIEEIEDEIEEKEQEAREFSEIANDCPV